MIYQTQLKNEISHIACLYCSIAKMREDNGYVWTVDELNSNFALAILKGYVDSNLCIVKPQQIADLLNTNSLFKGKFYLDYIPQENDHIIACWKLSKEATDAHFVVMDNSGIYTREHVIYDPWNGDSKTVREGIVTSLRVYEKQ